MTALFILFSAFAISIPVILESRRTGGDHILKQVGVEIIESEPIRRLRERMRFIPAAALRFVAPVISFVALIAVLWVAMLVVRWVVF